MMIEIRFHHFNFREIVGKKISYVITSIIIKYFWRKGDINKQRTDQNDWHSRFGVYTTK